MFSISKNSLLFFDYAFTYKPPILWILKYPDMNHPGNVNENNIHVLPVSRINGISLREISPAISTWTLFLGHPSFSNSQ